LKFPHLSPLPSQRGGFALGLIVGLLIGLALALIVALYVTKVPVPFINKVPQRTAEQDAAEVERNKQWDPNAGLSPARPAASAPPAVVARPPAAASVPLATARPGASAPAARNPAAILSGQPESPPASTKPGADPFTYFVQAGAYAKPEDAEQQRAKLAMMGFAAKVTEREQNGRTMYRVRLGPYQAKDEADSAQNRLQGSGVDAALVRVQR
jgi:cell division protein FtsN